MIPNEKKQTENISCPEYLNINRWFNAEHKVTTKHCAHVGCTPKSSNEHPKNRFYYHIFRAAVIVGLL